MTTTETILVYITEIGLVRAHLVQRYLDGDARVLYKGTTYIVRAADIKE